jgi:hypothetical protein
MNRTRSVLTLLVATAGLTGAVTLGSLGVAGAAASGNGMHAHNSTDPDLPGALGSGISQFESNLRLFIDQLFVPSSTSGGNSCQTHCTTDSEGFQTCSTNCL